MQLLIDSMLEEKWITKLYDKEIEIIAEKFDLSKIELEILLFLKNHPENNTAKDIANFHYTAKSFVSKTLINLVRKNFIILTPDKKDRRISRIFLQDSSLPIIYESNTVLLKLKKLIFDTLNEEELKQFIITTNKIKKALKYAIKEDIYE